MHIIRCLSVSFFLLSFTFSPLSYGWESFDFDHAEVHAQIEKHRDDAQKIITHFLTHSPYYPEVTSGGLICGAICNPCCIPCIACNAVSEICTLPSTRLGRWN